MTKADSISKKISKLIDDLQDCVEEKQRHDRFGVELYTVFNRRKARKLLIAFLQTSLLSLLLYAFAFVLFLSSNAFCQEYQTVVVDTGIVEGDPPVSFAVPLGHIALANFNSSWVVPQMQCLHGPFFLKNPAGEGSIYAPYAVSGFCFPLRGRHIMYADFGGGLIACNEFGETFVVFHWYNTKTNIKEFKHGVK